MLINEKLVKDYKKKGVTVIRKVISNFWLEKLSKGIEKKF